jgi:TRAP-type C4-dicarboxylate transport system permease small subunit
MRALDRLIDGLVRWAHGFVIVVSFFFATVLPVSVLLRYVFNYGFEWVDELSSILVATVMFVAIAVCFADDTHIRVEAVLMALPAPARRYVLLCSHAITAVFFALVGYFGYYVAEADMGISMSTLPLRRGPFLLVIPLASALVVLLELRHIARALGARTHRGDELEGVGS